MAVRTPADLFFSLGNRTLHINYCGAQDQRGWENVWEELHLGLPSRNLKQFASELSNFREGISRKKCCQVTIPTISFLGSSGILICSHRIVRTKTGIKVFYGLLEPMEMHINTFFLIKKIHVSWKSFTHSRPSIRRLTNLPESLGLLSRFYYRTSHNTFPFVSFKVPALLGLLAVSVF